MLYKKQNIINFLTITLVLSQVFVDAYAKDPVNNSSKIQKFTPEASKESDNEKKFNIGFTGAFEKSNHSFNTPALDANHQYRELGGYSLGVESSYKFYDNPNSDLFIKGSDIFFNASFSKVKGENSIDLLSNSKNADYTAYVIAKAKAKFYDYRLGSNVDFAKNNNFTPSLRIGGFYKELYLNNFDSYILSSTKFNSTFIGDTTYTSGQVLNVESSYTGLMIGGKLKHDSLQTQNVIIFDFYPLVRFKSKIFSPQENFRTNLQSADLGFGFKIAFEHYFKFNNQKLKFFSSYENIKISRLKERDQDGLKTYGDSNISKSRGNSSFNSLNLGVGIYF